MGFGFFSIKNILNKLEECIFIPDGLLRLFQSQGAATEITLSHDLFYMCLVAHATWEDLKSLVVL